MKKREGFVSNSSSASFIVTFKSNKTRDEILQDISDSMLWNSYGRQQFKELKQKDDVYLVEASTSMFNDWYDIAVWPFIRMLDEKADNNYDLVSLRKVEKEWSSCDYVVKFDPTTWEMEDVKFSKRSGNPASRKAKKTAMKNQEEYNKYYKTYLKHLKDDTISLSEVELSFDYFEDKYGG